MWCMDGRGWFQSTKARRTRFNRCCCAFIFRDQRALVCIGERRIVGCCCDLGWGCGPILECRVEIVECRMTGTRGGEKGIGRLNRFQGSMCFEWEPRLANRSWQPWAVMRNAVGVWNRNRLTSITTNWDGIGKGDNHSIAADCSSIRSCSKVIRAAKGESFNLESPRQTPF